MTTAELLDLINPEARGTFSHRAYRNSQDVRVMLIDMHYPDDVVRMADYIRENAPVLTVDVITAEPLGGSRRRRIVVTGFE